MLTVLVMVLMLLSACGEGSGKTNEPTPTPMPEYVYAASYSSLGGDVKINYVNNVCAGGDRLYFMASVYTGETITEEYETGEFDDEGNPITESYSYEQTRYGLFSANLDGSGIQELPNFVLPESTYDPENQWAGYTSVNVQSLSAGENGSLWVLINEYSYWYDFPEGYDPEVESDPWEYYASTESYYLTQIDSTGTELQRVDLSSLGEDTDYFYASDVDVSGGYIYVCGQGNVYVLDEAGAKLFVIECTDNSWYNNVTILRDGRAAVRYYDYSETDNTSINTLAVIDTEKQGIGDQYPVSSNAYDFITGCGDYDYFYNTGTSLFGGKLSSAEPEKLVTWINLDVDSDYLNGILPLEDGRIIALSMQYDYDTGEQQSELVTVQKVPSTEVPQRQTLTFACIYLDYNMRSIILNYNRSQEQYRIEVIDYTEYNTGSDSGNEGALNRLTNDITAGHIPDIFDLDNMPFKQYAAKGVFEDLWPWIDGDTELGGRDGLVVSVLNAMQSSDGCLYRICPAFSLRTLAGATEIVGEGSGWTVAELQQALTKMPAGCEIFEMGYTKNNMLNEMCYMNLDDFVDWQSGTCHFDSEEFINLLEFANLFPEEFDWDSAYGDDYDWTQFDTVYRLRAGRQMLASLYLNDFTNYRIYEEALGGDLTFKGYPGSRGNGTAFNLRQPLAMSSSCKNKEAAWDFLRSFLEDGGSDAASASDIAVPAVAVTRGGGVMRQSAASYFNYYGFPVNRAAFDRMKNEAMTPTYYEGNPDEQPKDQYWISEDDIIYVYALTEAQANKVVELIDGTSSIYNYDDSLYEIITDAVAPFFAGQRSASEVAAEIQSRATIYVNEQR